MIYKEWREIRTRYILAVVVYAVFTMLTVTIWSLANCNYWPERNMCWVGDGRAVDYVPTFRNWLTASFFINLIVGLLFGVDSIAEENNQGTLSFLLCRPISRSQIYYQKLILRLLAVASLSVTSNLAVLLFDQFSARPTPVMEALSLFALLVLVGLMTLCLGSLVSVFTKNTLECAAYTTSIFIIASTNPLMLIIYIAGKLPFNKVVSIFLLLLGVVVSVLLIYSGIYQYTTLAAARLNFKLVSLNLLIAGILAVLTSGCAWAGVFFFKRREY